MGSFQPEEILHTVQQLLQLLEQAQLEELEVKRGGRRILLRRRRSLPEKRQERTLPTFSETVPYPPLVSPEVKRREKVSPPRKEVGLTQRAHWVATVAPMSGIFWRSPSPGEPPFVEVGDYVEEGQTIGLLEAMKIFSEIPAEATGKVVAIPAREGHVVQQGDLLVLIDPEPSWRSAKEVL